MEQLSSKDLQSSLWNAADSMRSKMSADVYKDYLLGIFFYKSLSDRLLYEVVDLLEDRKAASVEEAQEIYEKLRMEMTGSI